MANKIQFLWEQAAHLCPAGLVESVNFGFC